MDKKKVIVYVDGYNFYYGRWLSGTHNLIMATICKISAALDAEVVKVADYELEPVYA